jgi:predicted lipid-binding transport protein (Tim44 family)
MASSMGSFDFTTLFFFAVAVIVFVQLRGVLGKRTGHEKPRQQQHKEADNYAEADTDADSNVVTLPRRGVHEEAPNKFAAIDAYADPGTDLNNGLRSIAQQDPEFTPKEFLNGAQMAYEMIVTAFAYGNRKELKALLSRDVYDSYVSAINERESRKETVRFDFVGMDKSEIVQAEIKDRDVNVTVRMVSQIISATLDSDEDVVEGDMDEIAEVIDVWTFSRDLKSRDPNWRLVASEPDNG